MFSSLSEYWTTILFLRHQNAGVQITCVKQQVKANFNFRLFNLCLSFHSKSSDKRCLQFAISTFKKKLQDIFQRGKKKWSDRRKMCSRRKKMFTKNWQTRFGCLFVKKSRSNTIIHVALTQTLTRAKCVSKMSWQCLYIWSLTNKRANVTLTLTPPLMHVKGGIKYVMDLPQHLNPVKDEVKRFNGNFFVCTFCFPNTGHVTILRRFDLLSCSLKRVHAEIFMLACTLFNEQDKGWNLLSTITWSVLAKQSVQAKKVYNFDYSLDAR